MKHYKLQNGTTLTGDSSLDIVTALRNQQGGAANLSTADFMARMADQQAGTTGKAMRHDTPEDFIEDLLETGYLVPVAE